MADLSSTRVFGKLTVLHEAILKANAEIVGTLTVDTVNATNYLGLPTEATRWPDWNEVTGKPTTFAPSAHTHPWGDLTGVPATASRWPTWAEVTSKPTFAAVATSGSYVDLSNTPNLATVATTGSYTDLVNRPSNATPTTSGFMSSGDKSKLDGVEAGAEVNTVDSVNGQTGVVSLDTNDVSEGTNLYFTTARARSSISVGGDLSYTNGVISFNETYSTASDIKTAYESNTNTNAYTDAEKSKLGGIANGADNYGSWTLSDGTNSEQVLSGGTITVTGSGATSAVYDTASNTLTISSTDTNTDTTYSAGTGISLSGTEFSLSDEVYTTAEKNKLSGIDSGATANSTDATLLDRANHTGSQAISTITNLQTSLNAKLEDAPSDGSQYARQNGSWVVVTNTGGGSTTVGDTAPTSPSHGEEWIDSETFSHYVYYDDGTSSQWVEVSGGIGKSAYQTALDQGFVGTEQEWLDSLVGPKGDPGEGVPIGGTTGQVLSKNSATDYDTSWVDPPESGVQSDGSVNNVVSMDQATYDAITTPDPNTLYVII